MRQLIILDELKRKSIKDAHLDCGIDSSFVKNLKYKLFQGQNKLNYIYTWIVEQPPGTLIGHLPSLSTHKYRVSGNEEAKRHIELDTSNGTLRVKQRVDRESLKTDQLILAFIDEDSLSVKTVKIRVNDM